MKRLVFLLPILFATPALAHGGAGVHGVLAAGLAHPLSGADHLLAMLAVGLWAAALGGRAVLAVPAAFLAAMLAGFGLALSGLALPAVEPAILASVVVLGLAAALVLRLPLAPAALLVGGFAIFHGAAHGAELGGAGAVAFGAGFVAATAMLHAAGVGLALAARRSGSTLPRILGAGTALAGAGLIVG